MRLAFEMKEHIFGEIPTGIVVERDVPALLAAIGLAHDRQSTIWASEVAH